MLTAVVSNPDSDGGDYGEDPATIRIYFEYCNQML